MSHVVVKRAFGLATIGLLATFLMPHPASADFVVAPGYDLLETGPGTFFEFPPGTPIPFVGVPLITFDFGGMGGVQGTGTADTIVRRLGAADSGGAPGAAPPIMIELVALQLRTSDSSLFVTLQSNRGAGDPPPGPPSNGTMTITFTDMVSGTFASSLNVNYDVRSGAVDGMIIASGTKTFMSSGTPWDRLPSQGEVEIPGVNTLLKGDGTRDQDFWTVPFIETAPDAEHQVGPARRVPAQIIPTLGGVGLLLLVLSLLAVAFWRLRVRSGESRG